MRGVSGVLLLVALPLFGSARDVTAPTFGASPYYISGLPVVASSADRFLTLWTADVPTAGPHVFGSLANAQGKTITPLSFVVCANARVLYVAPSQQGFVALLADHRGAYRVASISSEGKLFQLSAARAPLADSFNPRVAFDGKYFLVIARLTNAYGSASANMVTRFVDLAGNVNEQPFRAGAYDADVIHANGAFVTFSSNEDGVSYQRFAASGFPLSPLVHVSPQRCDAIAAAANGRTYAFACMNGLYATPDFGLNVSVVSTDGTPIATTRFHVLSYELRVSWTNDSYFVIAKSGASYAWRLDEGGKLRNESQRIVGFNSASIGDSILTVGTPDGTSVLSTSIAMDSAAMRIGDPDTLSYTLRRQSVDAIATDGASYIAMWTDAPAMNKGHVSGISLSSSAQPLDPGQTDLGATQMRSSISFGKTVYLIVSHENGAVVARRVLPRGGILDSNPIVIGNGEIAESAVAWNGSRFAVAWGRYSDGSRRLTFIDEQGEVSPDVTVPNIVTGRMEFAKTGSIVWDGRYFLLGSFYYEAFACTCPAIQRGIEVVRLTADGSFVDSVQIDSFARRFHIASGSRESLMVSDFGGSVYAQIIHADDKLRVDDGFPVARWYGSALSNVVWNGSSYTVAWQSGFAADWWLSTAKIIPPRQVIPETVIAASPGETETPPAMAFDAGGRLLVVTSEVAPTIGTGRLRAYAEGDLRSPVARPAAPQITAAFKTLPTEGGTLATVTWQSDAANITGFAIESVSGEYAAPVAIVDAKARVATIGNADRVRVRAFGPGGISEPSATLFATLPRHRGVRH